MLRRKIKSLLVFCALMSAMFSHLSYSADTAKLNGYLTLPQAQARGTNGQVEIIEFFSYTCPVCFSYETPLAEWAEKNRERIIFKRIPMRIRPEWAPAQKMYFTLELLDKADGMHKKVFDAIHQEHSSIKSDEAIFNLIEKLGINRQQFSAIYFSAAVQTKVKQALQMQSAYQIDQVPLVAIDGRYLTSPAKVSEMVGEEQTEVDLQKRSFHILDTLIAQIKSESSR